jgi:hypothetical protein
MKRVKLYLKTVLLACGLCSIHCVHAEDGAIASPSSEEVDAKIATLNSGISYTKCEQRPNAGTSEQWTSEKDGKEVYVPHTYCVNGAWYGSTIKSCYKLSCAEREAQAPCAVPEGYKCNKTDDGSSLIKDCDNFCAISDCEKKNLIGKTESHPCHKECKEKVCAKDETCFAPRYGDPKVCTKCNDIPCDERKNTRECFYDEERNYCVDFQDPESKKNQSLILYGDCYDKSAKAKSCDQNKYLVVAGDQQYCCKRDQKNISGLL